MSTVNKVILVGHLGTDPELRYTTGGQALCRLSVATNRAYLDKSGERQEKVSWHRVVTWGKSAEACRDHLRKGRQVYIEGQLDNSSYTDKEGKKRYSTEIVSQRVVFLGGQRSENEGITGTFVAPEPSAAESRGDELPF
jgi:single-strand DNA-binding protein